MYLDLSEAQRKRSSELQQIACDALNKKLACEPGKETECTQGQIVEIVHEATNVPEDLVRIALGFVQMIGEPRTQNSVALALALAHDYWLHKQANAN